MQVKKEEIRQKILDVAEDEFLKRGYEGASMRIIAKKANTTLGNIYHYFPNKEALLVELLTPTLDNLDIGLANHLKLTDISYTLQDLIDYIDRYEQGEDFEELDFLLDKKIVILLELNSSSLLTKKQKLLDEFSDHLSWHLGMGEKDGSYSKIIINMVTDCIKQALLENETFIETRKEFIKLFRFFCTGIATRYK